MNQPIRSTTSTIDIYIKLAQYPILQDQIRERMRHELFSRGVMSPDEFEQEVEDQAIESQRREGVHDPFNAEPFGIWEERKARIRAFHTDFYFAYNLPHALFEQIVRAVISEAEAPRARTLTFNPELAPWRMLFEQGEIYEALPPNEREAVQHHLLEIKVVLIRGMITDQLPLIGVAKHVLSISDLKRIYNRRIGSGKIGGKAAGIIIAWKILQQQDPKHGFDMSELVQIPESFFIGTEVMYEFRQRTGLEESMNQKYKSLEEIRRDYPMIVDQHVAGQLPQRILNKLRGVLDQLGDRPLIVRSSSLLEDNFGAAFAGKYNSYFCPNQGTPEQNLEALCDAIKRVYASTLNPDALLYRRRHGLIDYDERMAILIQELRGKYWQNYYFPVVSGVGFSQNPFRWNPKIRREEGFLRIVWGLGTRAVDRVSTDYPRLIPLSHPRLRPEMTVQALRQYSQHMIDVIDLAENSFRTLPIGDVLSSNYPYLRYIASIDEGGYMRDLVSSVDGSDPDDLILTFDYLTKDSKFVRLMRTALMRLEAQYGVPVDTEFAIDIENSYPYPSYQLWLLQCRPLSQREEQGDIVIPNNIPDQDVLFSEHRFVPNGAVDGIRYIVFVDPVQYSSIRDTTTRLEVGRVVGRINRALEGEQFILMGPGRWGSANHDLGVRVTYSDIFNARVIIEIAVPLHEGGRPELSYGTHFFQDLVEAGIYALPLHLDHPKSIFNWSFFRTAPNVLASLLPEDAEYAEHVRVIDLSQIDPGKRLNIYMDANRDEALGWLQSGEWPAGTADNGEGHLSTF